MPDEPSLHLSNDTLRALEPVLLAFARRSVRDLDTARELVQESLVAALGSPNGLSHHTKLRAWLIGILSHKISDFFRRTARAPLVLDPDRVCELLTPPSLSPEATVSRREALTVLELALGELSALERLAVLSVDVEDLDHTEACAALGVSPTHLRVLLHRGRHRLRKALENAAL